MHEKTSLLAVRKLVLVVVLLAGLAFVLTANVERAEAIASPHVCSYYSDATFTTVVGARGTGCCNQPISWGITTSFKKCQTLLCPHVICPD